MCDSGTIPDSIATFRYCKIPDEDDRSGSVIDFTCSTIRPLDYEALSQAALHKPITIPIEWEGAKILASTEAINSEELYNIKASPLQTRFTASAIGLVRGGWLPSWLGALHRRTVIVLDRNIVSKICGRFRRGEAVQQEEDFLDLFAGQAVRINPMLFAMEGNARGLPTPTLAYAQLLEAAKKLKAALPAAEIMASAESLRGMLGLIDDYRAGFARKSRFLMQIAPSLAAPVSRKLMQARWAEVLAAASECGVPLGSFVVLASLSTIAVPNGQSPAKTLLNLKPSYSAGNAYNALADLLALEMLVHVFALFPQAPIQLCTADKDLALFWTGMRASNFKIIGGSASCTLAPVEQLFPGWTLDECLSSMKKST
ncbi:MAG TPA: hypothetical protein VHY35_01585 [Stellaceae bacterium]|jgi:hypothetical protein|nr:hypothetical protein [Stellaceae bacterium]